jgi:hypothetical protein
MARRPETPNEASEAPQNGAKATASGAKPPADVSPPATPRSPEAAGPGAPESTWPRIISALRRASGKTGRSGESVEQRAPSAGRSDAALVGPPGARVSEAPMHHHVASAAQAVRADVGAKRLTIVLRVRLDYPMVLAAGIAHGRSLPAAGGVFGSQPPKRAHTLVVVESVVILHRLFPLAGSLKLRPFIMRGARSFLSGAASFLEACATLARRTAAGELNWAALVGLAPCQASPQHLASPPILVESPRRGDARAPGHSAGRGA